MAAAGAKEAEAAGERRPSNAGGGVETRAAVDGLRVGLAPQAGDLRASSAVAAADAECREAFRLAALYAMLVPAPAPALAPGEKETEDT